MRRIAFWMISTVVLLVLLFSYRTSLSGSAPASVVAHATQAPGVISSGAAPPGAKQSSTASARPDTKQSSTASAPPDTKPSGKPLPAHSVTVNGSVIETRWGPVQVQVQITGHKITELTTLIYPTGTGRDQEINSYALPILRRQALAAQSAQISGVSGATYTSDGYRRSLQAALDAAHFAA